MLLLLTYTLEDHNSLKTTKQERKGKLGVHNTFWEVSSPKVKYQSQKPRKEYAVAIYAGYYSGVFSTSSISKQQLKNLKQ